MYLEKVFLTVKELKGFVDDLKIVAQLTISL